MDEKELYWKRNLIVLWIAVFLSCASYTSCVPFLPVYILRDLHVPAEDVNFWAGLTYAVTFMGSTLMAPYWGALADYIGQRKMAIRAGLGLAFTYVLTALCQDAYQLLVVRALCGLISGLVPACLSMASSSLPQSRMGWGMGLMQTALSSGSIMGPLMGGYLSSWFGIKMAFYVGAFSLFAAAMGVIFIVKDFTILKEGSRNVGDLLADLRESLKNKELIYVMFMFFIVQCCVMTIQPLVTMYVGTLMGNMGDEAVKAAGFIFSLSGIAGILAAPYWGRRGQVHGYVRTFCLLTFIAGVINLFQIFIGNVWQFAAIQFVYGLFLCGAVPNINANLTRVTDENTRGKAFGLVTSANQFGGVVGPLFGGFLGSFFATPSVLVATGCILIMTASFSYVYKVKRA